MPLHDWTDRPGWDGMHHLWITELLRWIKPRLPEGYRIYVGMVPMMGMEISAIKTLLITRQGQLVAAIELISPRNKDRVVVRSTYLSRYLGYLLEGVHLLLVDVHRRPQGFSFADRIAEELQIQQPPCPTPLAVSYRVGEPAATGGRLLALWRRSLESGHPLPTLPLPLTVEVGIPVDLEQTYQRAAADAYLES